ncbi:hypothetical protein M098_3684 [Phocaeicola vulgatus str. 3775 SR(B) 19]|nr:hypothetical protein M098_3684 [Phocaeicola vulgatus str. 3775 SR(B) 19]
MFHDISINYNLKVKEDALYILMHPLIIVRLFYYHPAF